MRCLCYKARDDRRTIEVNHRLNEYKRKARELLTSEDGLRHRGRRCIEPEAVFGQMKFNMAYRRFRHFGKDKVTMDFAFFAIAFNIKKMCSKIAKQTKNGGKYAPFWPVFAYIPILIARESNILEYSPKISRLKNIRSVRLKNQRLPRKPLLRHSLGVGDGYFSFLGEEELGGAGALADDVEARGGVGYALTLKVVVDNRGVKDGVGSD